MPMTPAEALLRERIHAAPGRRMAWKDVMELALYDSQVGYYRSRVQIIGRGGDFFTSVSVGPVFGELVAAFCAQIWRDLGRPDTFAIIEQGANDGRLASDVLQTLRDHHSDLFLKVEYWIVEPSDRLREAQRMTLGASLAERLRHAATLADLQSAPWQAVFLANELLDAFPTHRVRWKDGRWEEAYVSLRDEGEFAFDFGPLSTPELEQEVSRISETLADGYTTDLNLAMLHWWRELDQIPFTGAVWILDYGLTAAEYFSETRPEGSLRRYRQHRMDDRVLEDLGESDLTTHVNFTRLADAAEYAGWRLLEFIEQGRFLTRVAASRFSPGSAPPKADWIRQFQSLTHPNHLGMSFHSLVLGRGEWPSSASFPNALAARRRLGLQERTTKG